METLNEAQREAKQAKEQELRQRSEALKKRFKIRSFQTTTESIEFSQKLAKAFSGLNIDFEAMKDEDASKIFEIFSPSLIKYVVGSFVYTKEGNSKPKLVNYEKDFIGDLDTVMMLFFMAVERLSQKASGAGKPQAQAKPQKVSAKRP